MAERDWTYLWPILNALFCNTGGTYVVKVIWQLQGIKVSRTCVNAQAYRKGLNVRPEVAAQLRKSKLVDNTGLSAYQRADIVRNIYPHDAAFCAELLEKERHNVAVMASKKGIKMSKEQKIRLKLRGISFTSAKIRNKKKIQARELRKFKKDPFLSLPIPRGILYEPSDDLHLLGAIK